MSETKLIHLSLVRIDGNTQYRDLVNQHTVKEYADRMRDGAEFPPVKCTFDGEHYWLWDGFHRYLASKAAEFRDIRVEFTKGTIEDAQDFALGANGRHGLPRNSATKRKQVEAALSIERHAHKSDREVARLCDVSAPFVASVRNPDTKERQAKNMAKHYQGKNEGVGVIELHPEADPIPRLTEYYGPDENELKAMELAEQADRELMNKMLEADDALALANAEVKRLNYLTGQLQIRIAVLMTEKNEAIKDAKRARAQLDKIRKSNRPVTSHSGHM